MNRLIDRERARAAASPYAVQKDRILADTARVLCEKLRHILQPDVDDEAIGLSFHIQDGFLNHFKEIDDFQIRPDAPEPDEKLLKRTLADAIRSLTTRLQMSLVFGYHGFVLLTIEVHQGQATSVCTGERVNKVASPRIPG
jgi:hypothetical protein